MLYGDAYHLYLLTERKKNPNNWKNELGLIYNRHPAHWRMRNPSGHALVFKNVCNLYLSDDKWCMYEKAKHSFHAQWYTGRSYTHSTKDIAHLCSSSSFSNHPRIQNCLQRRGDKKGTCFVLFFSDANRSLSLQNCNWPLLQRLRAQSPWNKSIGLNASEV